MRNRTKIWILLLLGPIWLPFVIVWLWLSDLYIHATSDEVARSLFDENDCV